MARTFQHVKLRPNMSLLDNVALGAHARTRAGFVAAALRLDRAEEARILAEAQRQLDRIGLGERAHELAGSLPLGTQRVLEIARALAADPVLLVLDEPAAGLRRKEKQQLGELLRRLRDEGVTILIVEHDMDFVMRLVDRLVVMNFGSKLVEGVPAAVRADRDVQAAYLGSAAACRRAATRTAPREMTPLLEIADLHVGYGRVEAVRGVSLALTPGQIVSVIGPNGAGKTTLLAAAMGLLPSTGTLRFDGDRSACTRRRGAGRARPLPRAREARAVHRAVGTGQPAARRVHEAARPRCAEDGACRRCSIDSRGWKNGARSAPARCRAASGRCSRSAGR